MEEHFSAIKQAYDEFYRSLLSSGRIPAMDTGIGYWGISVADEVFELFKKVKLDRHVHFLDLGHGDGKVVMIASLFTNASGIEFHPWLVDVSRRMKEKLSHLPPVSRARLLHGDYHEHSFEPYDVFFIFPDQKFSPKLQEKLLKEASGARLLVHNSVYQPALFEKVAEHDINGTLFHEYRI
ncbi:hypothetical protein D6764_00875 [Candidatus Woesearchaeota archaeon]|nr:MAG: hypothetical protein D6764_00875 [Candidatus Woesearchaeota archaeon]